MLLKRMASDLWLGWLIFIERSILSLDAVVSAVPVDVSIVVRQDMCRRIAPRRWTLNRRSDRGVSGSSVGRVLQKRQWNLRLSLKNLKSLQRDLKSPGLRKECVVSVTDQVILLAIAQRRDSFSFSFVGEDVVSTIWMHGTYWRSGMNVSYRCLQPGHVARDCKNEIVCTRCEQPGHRMRECKNEPICYKCKQVGHISSQCPNPMVCYNCGETGHKRSECPKAKSQE